jgi:hypothetical protein
LRKVPVILVGFWWTLNFWTDFWEILKFHENSCYETNSWVLQFCKCTHKWTKLGWLSSRKKGQADSWEHFTFKLKCKMVLFITSNVYVICQGDIFILNPMSLNIHFLFTEIS